MPKFLNNIDNSVFEFIIYKTDIVALKVSIDSSEILVVSTENSKIENNYLLSKYSDVDSWICLENIKIDKENSNVNYIFVNENITKIIDYLQK